MLHNSSDPGKAPQQAAPSSEPIQPPPDPGQGQAPTASASSPGTPKEGSRRSRLQRSALLGLALWGGMGAWLLWFCVGKQGFSWPLLFVPFLSAAVGAAYCVAVEVMRGEPRGRMVGCAVWLLAIGPVLGFWGGAEFGYWWWGNVESAIVAALVGGCVGWLLLLVLYALLQGLGG